MNPFSLFSRAANNLSLSPLERALIRMLEGAVASAFVSLYPAVNAYLIGQAVDWQSSLHLALAGAVVSFLLALSKYFKAQGDTPLAAPLAAPLGDLAAAGASSASFLQSGDLADFLKGIGKAAALEALNLAVPVAGVVPPADLAAANATANSAAASAAVSLSAPAEIVQAAPPASVFVPGFTLNPAGASSITTLNSAVITSSMPPSDPPAAAPTLAPAPDAPLAPAESAEAPTA
jgi:hypothetical protein